MLPVREEVQVVADVDPARIGFGQHVPECACRGFCEVEIQPFLIAVSVATLTCAEPGSHDTRTMYSKGRPERSIHLVSGRPTSAMPTRTRGWVCPCADNAAGRLAARRARSP